MIEFAGYAFLGLAMLIIAAAVLWATGDVYGEPREHLRIRDEIDGGRLSVIEDDAIEYRDAA